jgi:glycerate kinase
VRLLVAPQEFKGTLTAVQAAEAIASGLTAAFPAAEVDLLPMADGGPGTLDALLAARGGQRFRAAAHDPLMRPIEAEWGVLANGTAVVECAAASGLLRLGPDELDPLRATSYGTGELLAAALARGCRHVVVGLGGSAANDGGAGMAAALGYRLLDRAGRDLPPGGAALLDLERIDTKGVLAALRETHWLAATDVTNPLCGPEGASAVYGPQKGARPEDIDLLDRALRRLADVVRRDLGVDVLSLAGGGAAGGLGAGVVAFLGGELRPGAALVAEAAGLEERIAGADVVLTGEGRLDAQTAYGKAPSFVARSSRAAGRPVVCLAGSLGPGAARLRPLFDVIEVASEAAPSSTADAAESLAAAAVRALLRLSSLAGGPSPR